MSAKPLRVLHVEDCVNDSILLQFKLEEAGYKPVCHRVDTLAAMISALAREPWDLIIADFNIAPNFDGLDALMLAKTQAPDLPFLILSGALGNKEAAALMRAGANDYIGKGDWTRLGPAVACALRETEIRQAHKQNAACTEARGRAADSGQ